MRGFVKGVATGKESKENACVVGKAVEVIYHATNSHVILSLAFSENVLLYLVSNSKLATNVNSASGARGLYETMRKWLDRQTAERLPPLEGDVIVAFDNDQVIRKSYHAMSTTKASSSIVTVVVAAEISKDGQLQQQENLKPIHW